MLNYKYSSSLYVFIVMLKLWIFIVTCLHYVTINFLFIILKVVRYKVVVLRCQAQLIKSFRKTKRNDEMDIYKRNGHYIYVVITYFYFQGRLFV